MARAPREYRFETTDARLRLKPRKEPYWRQIVPGTFLGLAKGSRASSWIVRQRQGSGYAAQRIGTPDDHASADGAVVLTYAQAVRKATEVQVEKREPAPRHYADGQTLNQIVEDYIQHRTETPGGRTGRVMSDDNATATRQVWARYSGRLGASLVTALDAKALRTWHTDIAKTPPTKRGKVLEFNPKDPEQVRARQQTANRVLTVVKAALTHARNSDSLPDTLPDFWRRVLPFHIKDEALPRMMDTAEVTRLLNASPSDLRDLLMGALMTGARYGELAALLVSAYSSETGTVRISQGKTGKVLTQPLTTEGRRFFDRISAGRPGKDLMFRRLDGQAWTKSMAAKPVKVAAKNAGVPDVSFKATRATYGKLLLLATNKDIETVAKALGHSDSRITRKHYAALLPSEVAEGIAKLPSLGLEPDTKINKLNPKRARG